MLDESRLAIHQVTLREQWSFRESVEGLTRHGIHQTAIWREKLHEEGVREGAKILRDCGMRVTGFCVGGLVTSPNPLAWEAAIEDNRRVLEEAAAVGADHIVWIAGGLEPDSKDIAGARARALEAFARLVPDARAAGVKLGIEPLHPMICNSRSVLCTLEQANDWCDQLEADDIVGIVVDTYAVWWDPNLEPETRRAGSRICAFHVNDWLPNTEDLRLDRGMMGDGVIDIPAIRQMVERVGYSGACEVEIFSARNWWQRDPDEVIQVIRERCRTAV